MERQVGKAMCVGIIWSWPWKREAQGPVEAVLDDVRIGRGQERNQAPGGTWPTVAETLEAIRSPESVTGVEYAA